MATLTAVPTAASAYDFSAVAPSGQTLYYKIVNSSEVAVTYPNNTSDYYYGYPMPTGNLTIPSTVTNESIIYSVTSISYHAFHECSGLTSVSIPDGVTYIGEWAFYGCSGLSSITIPDGVTSIGERAFYYCANLTSIECMATTPPTIGNSYTFYQVPTNIPVYVPCGTLANYRSATGWSRFTNIQEIPVTEFDHAASTGQILHYTINSDGTTVTLSGHEDSISGELVIPSSVDYCGNTYIVTIIGSSAFSSCSTLTSIVIPETATRIEQNAFRYCRGLTEVVIPDNVTYIGDYAFSECSRLATVTIGASVNDIGSGAFYPCSALSSVYLYPTTPPTFSAIITIIRYNPFFYTSGSRMYYVPCGTKDAYVDAFSMPASTFTEAWTPYNVVLTGNNEQMASSDVEIVCTSTVNISATPNCGYSFVRWTDAAGTTVSTDNPCTLTVTQDTTLTAVFEAVTKFHATAPSGQVLFYEVNGCEVSVTTPLNQSIDPWGGIAPVGDLIIPGSVSYDGNTYTVTSIGELAFLGCNNLTSVIIPNSVTQIHNFAFSGCGSLAAVTIPNSVTDIGSSAFSSCALTSVIIPNSVTSIGMSAFSDCSDLASVTIPNSVTNIGQLAFSNCINLTSVSIPNSITTIQFNTFNGCSGLTSVTIGNSVTEIQDGAFANCDALTMTNYTGTITQWCNIDFGSSPLVQNPIRISRNFYVNEVEVTDLNIPNGITEIKDYAFFRCNSLTSVSIPNTVETIGQQVFAGCQNINSITIGNSVSNIGFRALAAFGLTSMSVASGNTHFDSRDNCNAVIQTDNNTLIAGCRTTVIPNTVTAIGDYAFAGYTDLTTITIPNAITSIGNNAFGSCTGLTEIITQATIPPTLGYDVFDNVPTDIPVYVPCGKVADYQAADGWNRFQNFIESNIHATECATGQTLVYSLSCDGNIASVIGYEGDCSGQLEIPSSITVNSQPYTITRINENAFYRNTNITSVSLPSTLTYIGTRAFSECSSLTNVSLSVSFQNNLDTIKNEAFERCFELVSFPFQNLTNLKYIGFNAFAFCNLSEVRIISGNLQDIAKGTGYLGTAINPFHSNPSLSVIVGTTNDKYSFVNNTIIDRERNEVVAAGITATVPTGVTSIADAAYCFTTVRNFIVPEGVTHIGYDIIFYGTVDSLFLPSTLTMTYGGHSFSACETLKYIEYAEGIQTIPYIETGDPLFEERSNHVHRTAPETIVLPSTVNSIEIGIRFKSLERIVCKALIPPTFSSGNFDINGSEYDDSLITVIVPCQSVEAYRAADTWRRYNIVGDACQTTTTKTITVTSNDAVMGTVAGGGEYANNEEATLTATPNCGYRFVHWSNGSTDNPYTLTVTQDTTLTAVFEAAGKVAISSPSGHTLYYNIDCANNTATVVPENDSYPYYSYEPSGELTIPSSITVDGHTYPVTSIGRSAFEGCHGITSVTIPTSVTNLDQAAFESTGLQSLTIPNSVTSIGFSAFRDCTGLTSITIPASVTNIDGNIFIYCSQLTTITVDAGNSVYDSRNSCNAIIETATNKLIVGCNTTTIPNTVVSIGSHAFSMFRDFPTIFIPNSVTSIGENAFYCCFNITTIEVDANNTTFDSRENCNAIIETSSNKLILGCINTVIPNTVTIIGSSAFEGCGNLSSITIPISVTSIEDQAFRGCDLSEVVSLATVPPTLSFLVFYNAFHDAYSTISLYIPCGSLADYQAATGWSNFTNIQEQYPYTLTANSADNTMGTAAVTTEPNCSSNTATITATANSGYRFDHWSNGSTANPCTITLEGDSTVTAIFAPNRYYVVTRTDNAQQGYARSSAATQNIDYANLSLDDFTQMTSSTSAPAGDNYFRAVLTTSITNGSDHYCYYQFEDVTGDKIWEFTPRCTGTWSLTYGIPNVNAVHCGNSMFTNTTIGDVVRDQNLAGLTVTYTNLGWLLEFPVAVHCVDRQTYASYTTVYWRSADAESNSDTAYFDYQSEVTVTAHPNTGYQFFRWSDGNTDNPRTVTVVSDTTFVAEFATETQSWDQATACPGWNNPNSFITGGVDVNIYSGHGVSISSNKPCPNPVTGVTGVSALSSVYSDSQLAGITTGGCSNAIPDNGNQFLIISDTLGYDPNTGNNLRYVPMHLSTLIKKSIRIGDGCSNGIGSSGNANSGAQLNYTMRVTPDNAVMIVYYAIVAQAPGHGQQGDPTVVIRATKKNNAGNWQQISDTLAYYFSSTPVGNNSNNCPNLEFATLAANGQTGWHTLGAGYSTVYYKDWERVVLDLSNFLYDTIQLQFLSYDCLYNAHYGYAYIAGECRPAGYTLPQDTVIHINMAMVGDSLFTQQDSSMVVTHPDSTYIKLSFNVEPTAERIEVLDQAQNLVATFYNATEEHIFRLTTGLYTIRAVFPSGAIFEGTIDFTNELQE